MLVNLPVVRQNFESVLIGVDQFLTSRVTVLYAVVTLVLSHESCF